MKIAVTSIMKDEPAEFVERWAKSAVDADVLLLADTGSRNGCDDVARDLGIAVPTISIRPWRFDLARNVALALVPEDVDVVVKVDVDEVLLPGWRDALEDAPRSPRYSYRYIWNHSADGAPDVEFSADHTHTRVGWMWEHPVHESLRSVPRGEEQTVVHVPGMTIEHFADPAKPRAQYLPLLEMAVAEAPFDSRMAHYYARELFFRGDWVKSREEFVRHLSLPTAVWAAERSQSFRYLAKMDDFPERWLLRAVAEDSSRREAWVDLANLALKNGERKQAVGYVDRAMSIEQRPGDYMTEAAAWDNEALGKILDGS